MAAATKVIFRETISVLAIVLVSLALAFYGITCRACSHNVPLLAVVSSVTAVLWIALWKGNSYLASYLSTRISWIAYPVRRFLVGFVATLVYTLAVVYALSFFYRTVFSVDISSTLSYSIGITVLISLFMHGRSFLINWRKTAIEAEKHQHESIKARYESLKNQVNPHFLFNSLNALTHLVYEDKDKAQMFIRQLSDVYRYVLDTQEKELVTLDEEVAFVRSYLYLQQIRFGEKLLASIDLEGACGYIPPLALQMLIENAIKHNVVSEDRPLTVRIFAKDGFLVVENTLQERTRYDEPSSGFGLENITLRYEAVSERTPEVYKGNGVFRVSIPLLGHNTEKIRKKMV